MVSTSKATTTSPHLSVVIPVHKAENCIDELYLRFKPAPESIPPEFEIVLVEDCGGDNSWQVIERLATGDPHVRGIQFSRNFDQHFGIPPGLDHCDGDWMMVKDFDLQDRPEETPRLYAKSEMFIKATSGVVAAVSKEDYS